MSQGRPQNVIVAIVLVGPLFSSVGCVDPWITGLITGMVATRDPVVEILGGDNDGFFYTVRQDAEGLKDLYKCDFVTGDSHLLASLPTSPMSHVAASGSHVAYTRGGSESVRGYEVPLNNVLVVLDLETGNERILHEGEESPLGAVVRLALEGDRVAYYTPAGDWQSNDGRLLVVDLTGREPDRELSVNLLHELHLFGDYLAYTASDGEPGNQVVLHDLSVDRAVTVAEDVPQSIDSIFMDVTADTVVWAVEDWGGDRDMGLMDVYAYDIGAGTTELWAEGLPVDFTEVFRGGTREHFLAADGRFQFVTGQSMPITVSRYDRQGNSVLLDEFPFVVGTGGARVVGDWAVWTNDTWQIVFEPLAGGERRIIDPD